MPPNTIYQHITYKLLGITLFYLMTVVLELEKLIYPLQTMPMRLPTDIQNVIID